MLSLSQDTSKNSVDRWPVVHFRDSAYDAVILLRAIDDQLTEPGTVTFNVAIPFD